MNVWCFEELPDRIPKQLHRFVFQQLCHSLVGTCYCLFFFFFNLVISVSTITRCVARDAWRGCGDGRGHASCVPSRHRGQLPRNASERIWPENCHWWVIWADIHLILKSLLCIESLAISPSKKYQKPPLPSLWGCQKCPSPHFFSFPLQFITGILLLLYYILSIILLQVYYWI